MKTTPTSQETSLDKIEKNTAQILKKINQIRPNLFISNLKLSKKAKTEKMFLINNLFPKSVLSIEKALETFTKISENENFSKLEKKDQDFILGLDKTGFKNSHYIKEINDFISKTNNTDDSFSVLIEESLYFNLLNSELSDIEFKLLKINT
jgi:hypothetical protein